MKNVFRFSLQKDPVTLDPQQSGERFSSVIIFLLFKGLTRLEADHSIRCDLATSVHVMDNQKKYVFHLGEHLWSDGTPITAHDFVYSWKRALRPEFPVCAINFFHHIKNAEKAKKGLLSLDKVGIYAKDDFTLVVELEYPCSYFLELTSFCPFFPVSSRAKEGEIFSICSGPFQLERWSQSREIRLVRNGICKNLAPVHLNAIHVKIIPNQKEAFTAFEKGALDWIGDPISPLPVNYLPAFLWEKKIKPLAAVMCCWFNTLRSPFYNRNLRKAFAYAVPRERLLKKLLLPNTLLATRVCPSILQEKEPSFSIKECSTTAQDFFRTAIEEMGVKRLKVTLSYEATDEFSRVAAHLKGYWEEIFEVSIRLEPLAFKEFWQRLPKQQFQMNLFCPLSQYSDVVNFLERFEFRNDPRNVSGWENADYQALLKQYRKTADRTKRQVLAEKAEALLLEEMPVAPLYYYHCVYLQKPHVKNLSVSPVGVLQFDRVFLEAKEQVSERSFAIRS